MRQEEKLAVLTWLLREMLPEDQQAMVFCATRQVVDYVTTVLRRVSCHRTTLNSHVFLRALNSLYRGVQAGVQCEAIYGSMEQTTRTGNLNRFRNRKCRVLVVTDVAARGIDVPLLDNVVNFDFPDKPKLFVHR
jgi:ATP-dependent RNA helicase DDX54/DBP10